MAETRARKAIRRAVEAKGATVEKLEWEKIGPACLMEGNSGGWTVHGRWPSGRLDDAYGLSVNEVLDWIRKLWCPYVVGDRLRCESSRYEVVKAAMADSLDICDVEASGRFYLLRRCGDGLGPFDLIASADWLRKVFELEARETNQDGGES